LQELLRNASRDYGVGAWEADFLVDTYHRFGRFRQDPAAAEQWLTGMARASATARVPLQLCMMVPRFAVASVAHTAVTNGRASDDYFVGDGTTAAYYSGNLLPFGYTALLLDALKLAPSKDGWWSTAEATPPGQLPHPNPELHAIVAVLSTGPVGWMDKLGAMNRTVLRRLCDSEGQLLKPSRALTAVDAMFFGRTQLAVADGTAGGHVWATHADAGGGAARSRMVVTIARTAPLQVAVADLYPPSEFPQSQSRSSQMQLMYRSKNATLLSQCVNGTAAVASGCVQVIAPGAALPITTEAQHADGVYPFDLLTVYEPVHCSGLAGAGAGAGTGAGAGAGAGAAASGWFFLGELDKYVTASARRFPRVVCSAEQLVATVRGKAGEAVVVTAITPAGLVLSQQVVIAVTGTGEVIFTALSLLAVPTPRRPQRNLAHHSKATPSLQMQLTKLGATVPVAVRGWYREQARAVIAGGGFTAPSYMPNATVVAGGRHGAATSTYYSPDNASDPRFHYGGTYVRDFTYTFTMAPDLGIAPADIANTLDYFMSGMCTRSRAFSLCSIPSWSNYRPSNSSHFSH
jgi:hypothetical protein